MLTWVIAQIIAPRWFVFDRIFCYYTTWRHCSHVSFMRHDQIQRFINEHPFTVFILGGDRVSIPIGMFCILLSGELFSLCNLVVTALSMVDDLLYVLAQHRVIPANGGAYALCYSCFGSLSGSSTMASLGVGSLLHFHLRTHVYSGTGKFLIIFFIHFIYLLGAGRTLESRGLSTLSESLAVPISVKKTCRKFFCQIIITCDLKSIRANDNCSIIES